MGWPSNLGHFPKVVVDKVEEVARYTQSMQDVSADRKAGVRIRGERIKSPSFIVLPASVATRFPGGFIPRYPLPQSVAS